MMEETLAHPALPLYALMVRNEISAVKLLALTKQLV